MVEGLLRREEAKGERDSQRPKTALKRLTRHEIRTVFEKGKKIVSPLFVLFLVEDDAPDPSYAIHVKKKLGTAAERNRTKRIFRETLRCHKMLLRGYKLILIPRSESKEIELAQAVDQMREILLGMQRKK